MRTHLFILLRQAILTRLQQPGLPLALALALSLTWITLTYAQGPGDLDTSFNQTGIVTTSVSSNNDFGYSVAVQPDGKLIVAGLSDSGRPGNSATVDADMAVIRYNPDGSLDPTFNNTGIVTASLGSGSGGGSQNAVAIQPDGKVVVAGSINNDTSYANSDFILLRYQSNGSLDFSFNGTGTVTTSISSRADVLFAVAIQPDGKIIAAGHSDHSSGMAPPDFDFALVRYNNDGSLDSTFNQTGIVTTPVGNGSDFGVAIAVGPDSKIVMAGANFGNSPEGECGLVRYKDDGSLDPTFNGAGIVTTPCNSGGAYDVAIQPDGKIVVSGAGFVMRYNDDGSLDTSFNDTSVVNTTVAGNALALQFNGKIVVAGFTSGPASDFAVARYQPNGSLDTTFNQTGIVTTSVSSGLGFAGDVGNAVTIQPDGRIVIAGYSFDEDKANFTAIRYLGDSFFTFLPLILK